MTTTHDYELEKRITQLKNAATDMFHDDHSHGDLAIYDLVRGFRELVKERELAAQENGVAWTIGLIDKIHAKAPSELDKEYKGLKNTIRDAYEVHTGIDPAPNYPVKATLKSHQQKGQR